MNPLIETKTVAEPVEFRSSDDGKTVVATGYAAVFDSPSKILDWGYTETVDRTVFNKTLGDRLDVRAQMDHRSGYVGFLARTAAETLTLAVDNRGLRYQIDIPDTTVGRDFATLLERKEIRGSSFGFIRSNVVDEWSSDSDGKVLRTLKSVQLDHVAPLTEVPAYDGTSEVTIGLRSLAEARNLDIRELTEAAQANQLSQILETDQTKQGQPTGHPRRRRRHQVSKS